MNIKLIISFVTAALLAVTCRVTAEETNVMTGAQTALQTLVNHVRSEVAAGKSAETDFAGDLKAFDKLIADEKGTNNEDAALTTFMKGMLYVEVFRNFDKASEIMSAITTNYPGTMYSQKARDIVEQINAAMAEKQAVDEERQQRRVQFPAGRQPPDFDEKSLSGSPISIARLKGNVVLIDFWATWCPPCRAELPKVIQLYKQYHSQGFEIIGVSLDSDRDTLDKFLKQQNGMTWPQYFDGQGWGNKLVGEYDVHGIPSTLLIGRDGKIIEAELHGQELEDAVAKAVAAK